MARGVRIGTAHRRTPRPLGRSRSYSRARPKTRIAATRGIFLLHAKVELSFVALQKPPPAGSSWICSGAMLALHRSSQRLDKIALGSARFVSRKSPPSIRWPTTQFSVLLDRFAIFVLTFTTSHPSFERVLAGGCHDECFHLTDGFSVGSFAN